MLFEEDVVHLVLLHNKLKKNKRKHKFWMHLLLNSKQERDMFYTAFNGLRNDGSEFLNYFRTSIVPDDVLQNIRNDISATESSVSKLWSIT
jgi:hypothetical protein